MNFWLETPQTLNCKAPTNPYKCKSVYLQVANEMGISLGFVYYKNAVVVISICHVKFLITITLPDYSV